MFGDLLLMGMMLSLWGTAAAQWQPSGTLNVPVLKYSFLAATPSGDLAAATFNSVAAGQPAAELPAVVIRNPGSASPQIVELTRAVFPAQRGYGGIACDALGNFYLSGDTGEPGTCFVRKFKPDGSPDPSFGQGGEVRPGRRCLGLDVFGDYMVLAIDWCQFQVYRASTGQLLGVSPVGDRNIYVRDIAIDPVSLRVYGVAAGGVVVWEGGAPWSASEYRFRIVTAASGVVRSGEGISLDPIKRTAIVIPVPGNTLLEVANNGQMVQNVVTTSDPAHHLADSVVSFDGSTLFVSNLISGRIHVLKRGAPTGETLVVDTRIQPTPAAPAARPAVATPSTPAQAVTWFRSYEQIIEQARNEGKPMIVYFRKSGVTQCEEIEQRVLLSSDFNRHAQPFVCVFEDIAINPLLAYRFGVFRVPHIAVLNRFGEIVARFSYDIQPAVLYSVMEAVR